MFQFFGKKHFLVDLLGHFADIHNHILPGIDDGAKTPEESLELVRAFEQIGITRFITTPHILKPLYPNTPETIRGARETLLDTLLDHKLTHISIEASAEHMIDDGFEDMMENQAYMPMRGGYLLVEMSFLQPPLNFKESIVAVTRRNLTAILAHPERYLFLHRDPGKYARYKAKGMLFQLNMLSLGDYYEKQVQQMAFKLLDEGLVDFLASDMHNMKHFEALKRIQLPQKRMEQLRPVIDRTIELFY
ncbi:tyrosine-protein phosphatase [Robiginitalea sediminis]|uniref:tyrosine-protein phosphatase n=1 Tax=Robiginitalea sediminis TaxID=1982593 RepID=UPI000B4B1316|nr:CpsB/CapC family capsule biosynthesis tyrosine phosphatase [Robiginitalea sediminis]